MRKGWTLVELLTVVAIISVLTAFVASSTVTARRKAREAACTSYKRQLEIYYYNDTNWDELSPNYTKKKFMEGYSISRRCWECHPSFP